MRYYKDIENGYIIAIGTGDGGGTEIAEEEYNTIMSVIRQKPPRADTTDYRLKEDLTWEEYYRPPDEAEIEADSDEALDILLGVVD